MQAKKDCCVSEHDRPGIEMAATKKVHIERLALRTPRVPQYSCNFIPTYRKQNLRHSGLLSNYSASRNTLDSTMAVQH